MSINDIYSEIENYKNLDKNEIYNKLVENYQKKKVDFVMYDLFQYIHKETEEKEKRLDQQTFKKDLVERYKKCIITGVTEIACEACHIIPFSECENNDKYNVNNGLLMRADLHKLFDSGYLKINPNTLQVEISNNILDEEYQKYNGKKLNIHEKSIYFLNQIY
jgi:hypothetical protein